MLTGFYHAKSNGNGDYHGLLEIIQDQITSLNECVLTAVTLRTCHGWLTCLEMSTIKSSIIKAARLSVRDLLFLNLDKVGKYILSNLIIIKL